jgi:hypothetical protein
MLAAWPGLNDADTQAKPYTPEKAGVKENPHRPAKGMRPNLQAPEAVVRYIATGTRVLAYRSWTKKHHNGGARDTSSDPADLDHDVRQGARILRRPADWRVETDRAGGNYRDPRLRRSDPRECHRACERDPGCRAWTLVRAGIQGPEARCWLEDSVPASARNDCCVSGVKQR